MHEENGESRWRQVRAWLDAPPRGAQPEETGGPGLSVEAAAFDRFAAAAGTGVSGGE